MWLPAIIIMIVIFYFSAQPAEESADLSGGLSYHLVTMVKNMFGLEWNQEEVLLISERLDYPVRKMAHLTEYALLGISVAFGLAYGTERFVRLSKENVRRLCFETQRIGSLYAVSDEIHQLFVPGRAGMVGDVLIDSVGVLVGFGVFIGLKQFFGRS